MSHKGFSHVGLSTLDLDKTREFYEDVLGFKAVVADTIKIKEGGRLRHIFFDTGRDQLIAFLEPQGVPGVPAEYDAGINRGLGVPAGFYHFAFEAGSEAALAEKRDELSAKGVEVTDIVDHEWSKSIYFKDPNGLSLEYCCQLRSFTEDDARMQERFTVPVAALELKKAAEMIKCDRPATSANLKLTSIESEKALIGRPYARLEPAGGGQDQYLKTIPELAAEQLHRREGDGDKQEVRYKLSRCALSCGGNWNVSHFGKIVTDLIYNSMPDVTHPCSVSNLLI